MNFWSFKVPFNSHGPAPRKAVAISLQFTQARFHLCAADAEGVPQIFKCWSSRARHNFALLSISLESPTFDLHICLRRCLNPICTVDAGPCVRSPPQYDSTSRAHRDHSMLSLLRLPSSCRPPDLAQLSSPSPRISTSLPWWSQPQTLNMSSASIVT